MGAPSIPRPLAAPKPADTTRAQLSALAFAETQRRLRQSQGRKSQFVTTGKASAPGRVQPLRPNLNSLLGG